MKLSSSKDKMQYYDCTTPKTKQIEVLSVGAPGRSESYKCIMCLYIYFHIS